MLKWLLKNTTVRFVLGVFLGSFIISYEIFRIKASRIDVQLAPVQFKTAVLQDYSFSSELLPRDSWRIATGKNAEITYLMEPGREVKKGEAVAVINEKKNKAELTSALLEFKGLRQADPQSSTYIAAKARLQQAKQATENSLVLAPRSGHFWINLNSSEPLGQIEDRTQLVMEVSLPSIAARRAPPQVPLTLLGKLDDTSSKPIELLADVFFAKVHSSQEEMTPIRLRFDKNSIPLDWLHTTIRGVLHLPALKNIALIKPTAVIGSATEPRIVVVNASGNLEWRSISNEKIEDQFIVRGVEHNTFKVILPNDLKRLKQAIAKNSNVRIVEGS